jgi:hypothetical protein
MTASQELPNGGMETTRLTPVLRHLFINAHGRDLEVGVRERGRVVCGGFTVVLDIRTGVLTVDVSHAV